MEMAGLAGVVLLAFGAGVATYVLGRMGRTGWAWALCAGILVIAVVAAVVYAVASAQLMYDSWSRLSLNLAFVLIFPLIAIALVSGLTGIFMAGRANRRQAQACIAAAPKAKPGKPEAET